MKQNQKTKARSMIETGPLKLDKSSLSEFAGEIIQSVMDGERSALKTVVELKALKKAIDEVLGDGEVMASAIVEAHLYGKGDSEYRGASFRVKNTPARWDFSASEEWQKTVDEIARLKELKKGHEAALKALYNSNIKAADMNTGEELQVKKIDGGETLEVRN